jgi:magnesium chelatase subunit H
MKRKRTSAADRTRVVLVTLDAHLGAAAQNAARELARDLPGLSLSIHVAADWHETPAAAVQCRADLALADIIIVTQLFLEEHVDAVRTAIVERRAQCDAVMCAVCAPELVRLTRMGQLDLSAPSSHAATLFARLRGRRGDGRSAGERQLRALRLVPSLLRFVPGTAQDVRIYLLALRCWLSASAANVATLVRLLVERYCAALRGRVRVGPISEYADVGLYSPVSGVPADPARGRVGVLLFRSYVLANNTAHYDAVIRALEARGVAVIAAYTATLDARPAIDRFFRDAQGHATIDALVSLTGFSLVGGPAYTDATAAQAILADLDVPYIVAQPLEFQTVDQWKTDPRGLSPVQAMLQVAIPELDGAIAPVVFAGKREGLSVALPDRVERLAGRVARLVALRHRPKRDRRVAIIVFNFPPNAGHTGSAAYLAVFDSLQRTLAALAEDGYTVELPDSVESLRRRVVEGNAERCGTPANVHARLSADAHIRAEPHLREIERTWGPAPGTQLTDGQSIFVMGERFGNVFVGVQPAFGWEGDPMRLLFEGTFAPTHAFSAFYRWIRDDFKADVMLHFGTHGALEFMPGKQVGLTGSCWPDRLIGDVPHVYLYASNNSSEGTLAKRRGAATLVSYLTPPLTTAGLYRGLADLQATITRHRGLAPDATDERARLETVAMAQAEALDLGASDMDALRARLLELEQSLIPVGLHTVGVPPSDREREEMVTAIAHSAPPGVDLAQIEEALRTDHEMQGLLHALDGHYVRPVPGGDIVRSPSVVPTGRNIYGFDPYRVPSAFALAEGKRQVEMLVARHGTVPETVALVLWGTDSMKSEGEPIAQALALFGATPRYDSVGRLCGARLLTREQLGRARIDVLLSVSGVFRDLFPLQIALLAEAAYLAAQADEPDNAVRRHALATQRAMGCDLATAALRVFSNAEGAYGSNVNLAIEAGRWADPDELAELFVRRKSVAYAHQGRATAQPDLMRRALKTVDLTYQNLDSVELGTTDIDQYVEALGGLSRAVRRERGDTPAYVADFTTRRGAVRTLSEQVELETRTRTLNPKWYDAQLAFGYEGVRNIASRAATTLGWSATTDSVAPWVYREMAETFVLDPAMRERLARLNPAASAGLAGRLLEATSRGYWVPDADTLTQLTDAAAELEDRLEGVT